MARVLLERGLPRIARREVPLLALAAACLLAIPAVPPVLRALDPPLAVAAAYPDGHVYFSQTDQVAPGAEDPWGSPWCWRQVATRAEGNWYTGDGAFYAFYSAGPNATDDGLKGDDIPHRYVTGTHLVSHSSELLLGLATILVWLARGPGSRPDRAASLAVEARRAALVASLPLLLTLGAITWVQGHPWAVSLQEVQRLVVPAPVAWYGSACVLWGLVALALRLTRSFPDAPEPTPISRSEGPERRMGSEAQ